MNRSLTLSLCLFLLACGNAAPTDPTDTTTTIGTQTTRTFTSTVTGNPVAGARITVAGAAYTTDAAGTITLSTPAVASATMDASAAGFLDRVTVVGSVSAVTLWQIPAGADANFVRQLAYNRGGTPEVLWRPAASAIYLQLTGELASDPEVRTAHVQAAAMASAMTDGKVLIQVGSPAGAALFTVLLNASNPGTATTYLTQSGGVIQSGRMEYTTASAARTIRVIAHELGHVLGFGHAPSGLMCPNACGVDAFGPWERDVFVSMWQRLPGTAPLDNDRVVRSSSEGSTTVVHCDIR